MSTQRSKLFFQGILELQNSAYSHSPKENNQGIYYGLTYNPYSKPPHPTSENLMQYKSEPTMEDNLIGKPSFHQLLK